MAEFTRVSLGPYLESSLIKLKRALVHAAAGDPSTCGPSNHLPDLVKGVAKVGTAVQLAVYSASVTGRRVSGDAG